MVYRRQITAVVGGIKVRLSPSGRTSRAPAATVPHRDCEPVLLRCCWSARSPGLPAHASARLALLLIRVRRQRAARRIPPALTLPVMRR